MSALRMKASRCASRGFSLIELMVVVAIAALLALFAMPNFAKWMQNSRTRSVAESVQNGLRFAQTEAARLNRMTNFNLTSGTSAWTVTYQQVDTSIDVQSNPLQRSPAGNLDNVTVVPATATEAFIQFNPLGRPLGSATATGTFAPLTQDSAFNISNTDAPRQLRVTVSVAGKIRMCDPDKTFSNTTPDGC